MHPFPTYSAPLPGDDGAMIEPERNIGNTDQQEVIEEGMQGATGNVDANGLDKDMSEGEKQEKLDELQSNLSDLGQ